MRYLAIHCKKELCLEEDISNPPEGFSTLTAAGRGGRTEVAAAANARAVPPARPAAASGNTALSLVSHHVQKPLPHAHRTATRKAFASSASKVAAPILILSCCWMGPLGA